MTGLVAQQQCVGPLHTPLADVAVVALSHFDTVSHFIWFFTRIIDNVLKFKLCQFVVGTWSVIILLSIYCFYLVFAFK